MIQLYGRNINQCWKWRYLKLTNNQHAFLFFIDHHNNLGYFSSSQPAMPAVHDPVRELAVPGPHAGGGAVLVDAVRGRRRVHQDHGLPPRLTGVTQVSSLRCIATYGLSRDSQAKHRSFPETHRRNTGPFLETHRRNTGPFLETHRRNTGPFLEMHSDFMDFPGTRRQNTDFQAKHRSFKTHRRNTGPSLRPTSIPKYGLPRDLQAKHRPAGITQVLHDSQA